MCGATTGTVCSQCVGLQLGQFAVNVWGYNWDCLQSTCGATSGTVCSQCVGLQLGQFAVNVWGYNWDSLQSMVWGYHWDSLHYSLGSAPLGLGAGCSTFRRAVLTGLESEMLARLNMAHICLRTVKRKCTALTGSGFFSGFTAPVAFVLFQEALQLKLCAVYTTGIPQT